MAAEGSGRDDVDLSDMEAQCRTATNVVLDVALDHCSDDALEDLIAHMIGLSGDVGQALADAPETLEASDCLELRLVRGWVVSRVIELVRGGDMQVADAVAVAWDEANDTCGWE